MTIYEMFKINVTNVNDINVAAKNFWVILMTWKFVKSLPLYQISKLFQKTKVTRCDLRHILVREILKKKKKFLLGIQTQLFG